MLITFHELWLRREAAARRLLSLDTELANHVADTDRRVIADLSDPHRKRFLFDDSLRVAEEPTSLSQAMPASCMGPSLANQSLWGRARLRACAPACACLCDRCAYLRSRAYHARWGADPP